MRNILIFGLLVLSFSNCKKSNAKITPVCDGSNPTYNSFVANLIASKCASCHDYSTYQKLLPILQSGKFAQEVLSDQSMPKNNTISESDLNTLQCWVESGYPEN